MRRLLKHLTVYQFFKEFVVWTLCIHMLTLIRWHFVDCSLLSACEMPPQPFTVGVCYHKLKLIVRKRVQEKVHVIIREMCFDWVVQGILGIVGNSFLDEGNKVNYKLKYFFFSLNRKIPLERNITYHSATLMQHWEWTFSFGCHVMCVGGQLRLRGVWPVMSMIVP